MSEAKLHFDTEPITALPSEEIIANPSVAWHAIRGYDFAGLEGMLQSGLLPAENQQDYSVSVSVSPEQAWSNGREANSFYAYTLQDGISLAIEQKSPLYPSGSHGGFVDEARLASVAPEAISGVFLPEEALNRPLTQLATRHEARKPLQARQFIKRTLEHIQDLGGKLSDNANVLIEDCLATSASGQYLTAEQSLTLETSLMQAYSDVLTDRLGIAQPTVSDALRVVFDRAKTKPSTYVYSAEQKREIGSRNASIAVRNQTRNVGQLGLSTTFRF